MRSDTRKLVVTGTSLTAAGVLCTALLLTVFGGVSHQGPHTNGGWLALILALGFLPLGLLVLLLGLAKLFGDRSRN